VSFAEGLQSLGCINPMELFGTGLGGANYVYYAQCPASTSTDNWVALAECDSVMHAYEFASVACGVAGLGNFTYSSIATYVPPVAGYVYVEWDPHGSSTND
jgi:hypothetical protein